MKLKYILSLFLIMLMLSTGIVLAEEDTDDLFPTAEDFVMGNDARPGYGKEVMEQRPPRFSRSRNNFGLPFGQLKNDMLIENMMTRFDLTEDNTIGELLDAIDAERENREGLFQNRQIERQVDWLERAREVHDLDEDMTDEEVKEYIMEQQRERTTERLGLDADATNDEIKEALEDLPGERRGFLRNSQGRFLGLF